MWTIRILDKNSLRLPESKLKRKNFIERDIAVYAVTGIQIIDQPTPAAQPHREPSPCAASSGKLESADSWAGEARDNNFIAWRVPNYHGSEQLKDAEKEEHKI